MDRRRPSEGESGSIRYGVFSTAIGSCGIAWSPAGIAAVCLPEKSEAATRARLRRRFPKGCEDTPCPDTELAIAEIRALLDGEPTDLSDIRLDMRGIPAFHRRAYEALRRVGPGATTTYGELAARIGEPGSARAIGQAMGRNPFPLIVPCHRVLAAGGKAGGFSSPGGVKTKFRLLEIEGATAVSADWIQLTSQGKRS